MVNSKLEKHIVNMHVNGMDGRMLRLPAPKSKKRNILLLYGHHSSLERMFGLAEVLNEHGSLIMPDLPGLGGMDSFYRIGQKPTLDNYADYLASLIKLYYKRRRLTIFAMSFSVPLVVRMLQKYPELAKKVDLFISIAGFVHRDDFIFSRKLYWTVRSLAYIFNYRLTAAFARRVILTRPVIKSTYMLVSGHHDKMKDAVNDDERRRRIDFEIGLWQKNDLRTRTSTLTVMFTVDLCKGAKQLAVPAYHVTATQDRYFDHEVVKQHMHIIFKDLKVIPSKMANHAPTIVATAEEAKPYIPKRLRTLLG